LTSLLGESPMVDGLGLRAMGAFVTGTQRRLMRRSAWLSMLAVALAILCWCITNFSARASAAALLNNPPEIWNFKSQYVGTGVYLLTGHVVDENSMGL